jgi:hypothetical protein
MRRSVAGALLGLGLIMPSAAYCQTQETGTEIASMSRTMIVTLLNEGGKYVAVDLKHIPEGGTCRMDEGATIIRIGVGATADATRVRHVAPQVSSGGCPFLTLFDLPTSEYTAARASFLKREAEASKKIEQIKKDLGDKWDELMGKK